MPKPPVPKECEIFSNARKTSSRSVKISSPVESVEDNSMASVTDVLTELKSLRSEFSSKLDGINNQLGELTNSISVMENNLGEIKRDVTANEKRIEEAEARYRGRAG